MTGDAERPTNALEPIAAEIVYAVVAGLGIASLIGWAWSSREWTVGAVLVGILATIVSLTVAKVRQVVKRQRRGSRNEGPTTFRTFSREYDPQHSLEREDLAKSVATRLSQSPSGNKALPGVHVVVGASGSGKTTLLKHLVPKYDVSQRTYHYSTASRLLRPSRSATISDQELEDAIVVADQFEHLLEPLRWGTHDANRELSKIRDGIDALLAIPGLTLVLGVRDDQFTNLAFLGARVPSLSDCMVLGVSGAGKECDFRLDFDNVALADGPGTGWASQIEFDESATPLEMYAIGETLERGLWKSTEAKKGQPPAAKALALLVSGVVDVSPDPRTTWRVLAAIASGRELKKKSPNGANLTSEEIMYVVGEKPDEAGANSAVDEALDHLQKAEILQKEADRYAFPHDSLAPVVDSLVYEHLDSVVVLNIKSTVASEELKWPEVRSATFAWAIGGLILLVALCRLFVPWDGWYALSTIGPLSYEGIGDPLYLPTAIAELAWCFYILRFESEIYRFADTGSRERRASFVLISLLLVLVVSATFLLQWWILLTALGGVAQGLKSLSYARSRNRSTACRDRYREGGGQTVNNSVTVALAGIIYAVAISQADLSDLTALFWTWTPAYPLALAALVLYRTHLSAGKAEAWRGLLMRPQTVGGS